MPPKKTNPRLSGPIKSEYRKRVPHKAKTIIPHPVFAIRFKDGLATRNRLPLEHVIRVLTEIKNMLEAVGKEVHRGLGVDDPTGDFGLEIIGGFQRGSVKTALAITKNHEAGVLAARQVLNTVTQMTIPLGHKTLRRAALSNQMTSGLTYDPRIVSRLGNINKLREIDKTNVEIALVPQTGRRESAVINDRTSETLASLRTPNFAVENITIYGKLHELRDRREEGDEIKKSFFGELTGDDGHRWRIEFRPNDAALAAGLFRHQIFVTGNAVYYTALNPKIIATDFGPDDDRDYGIAFDEMLGASPELSDVPLSELVKELETD